MLTKEAEAGGREGRKKERNNSEGGPVQLWVDVQTAKDLPPPLRESGRVKLTVKGRFSGSALEGLLAALAVPCRKALADARARANEVLAAAQCQRQSRKRHAVE